MCLKPGALISFLFKFTQDCRVAMALGRAIWASYLDCGAALEFMENKLALHTPPKIFSRMSEIGLSRSYGSADFVHPR